MRIVLVHGAWADGSSWAGVIRRLQAAGHDVIAPQLPHTSLADNVAKLHHVLTLQAEPTVVAAHSYGGQVITALGPNAPNVVGLVYVAGFGLDEGESIGALLGQGPPTPAIAHLQIDEQGFAWLPEDPFLEHFAPDVDPVEARVMCAVQQPLAAVNAGRRDGDASVEDLADVVRRRPARRSHPSRRRAAFRAADGCHHRRGGLEPRRDDLAPRGRDGPHSVRRRRRVTPLSHRRHDMTRRYGRRARAPVQLRKQPAHEPRRPLGRRVEGAAARRPH